MTQKSHCWAYTLRKPELKETLVLIAALFTIAKTWKQPRCPLAGEWIKKMWHVYATEYYSAMKRNEVESLVEMWMDLESVIQNAVSQK